MGHLWLAGMMGTGKTTVGALVAERLQRPLLDTDAIVMESTGRTIPELFDESEWLFRAHERSAVVVAAAHDDAVVATGGGAVLDAANREVMRSSGTVVVLAAPAVEIIERIADQPGTRPLADDVGAIERLIGERAAVYAAVADHRVDTAGKPPDAVAQEVLAWIAM